MSTSSRRVLMMAVAAIIAVLTGVVVGVLSARASCHPALAPEAATSPSAAVSTPTGSPVAGLGGSNAEPVRPSVPAPPPVAIVERQPVCGSRDSFEALPALAALGGAGLAGLAVLALMLAGAVTTGGAGPARPSRLPASPRPGSPPPVPATPAALPTPAAPPAPAGAARRTEADRAALVRACIYVRDRITSKALADRLGAALQEAGVNVVEPAGERFDPAHHEAGGATTSEDPGKVGTIAAVEVPGYSDRGRVLRAPVVTVYQASGNKSGPRHAQREGT